MKKGATTPSLRYPKNIFIIALRNEKGSYNAINFSYSQSYIIALRNEKGSYNDSHHCIIFNNIIALRNEKGSYNRMFFWGKL